ncbi:MAG: hypothetical protein H8D49_03785, partial [Dehalococcoidia bacterium]|nr:hypothetical protein [Dehalococcoidia bacterium]
MKRLAVLIIVFIVLLTGCAAPPAVKGTFIDGVSGGDAETLNWLLAADASSFSYAGMCFDSLATYDNDW